MGRVLLLVSSVLSLAACGGNDGGQGVFGPNGENDPSLLGGSGAKGEDPDGGSNAIQSGCQARTLGADQATPNMLIVLDRSTSMTENDDNTDRWSGSRDAVGTVVTELEDRIRFGLMTFPAAGRGRDQCAPGEVDEPIQIFNAGAITGTLAGMNNNGYTPTAQTLEEARAVMAEQVAENVGEFALSQYVMLVTDGDPNCMGGPVTGDTQAQQASIDAVQALTDDGVKTYVIGFQTGGSSFAGVLDQMAVAGNTGATAHRSVDSGAELLDEFRRIAAGAVSCSFVLAARADVRFITITVDGVGTTYGEDWTLRDDQQTVDLLGATCDALQSGSSVVQAQVSCDPVNLL